MKTRKLGLDGPDVSAIGLGCMSFAGFFGTTDKAESFECLDAARDQGITFLDTAELYGKGYSEELIGELRNKDPQGLSELMGLSEKLANLNFERNMNWEPPESPSEDSRQAIFAFKGDVYKRQAEANSRNFRSVKAQFSCFHYLSF